MADEKAIDISELRIKIDQLNEKIISGLKTRSRFPLNESIYSKEFVEGKTWIDYRLKKVQDLDSEFGRFLYYDQQPFKFKKEELSPAKVGEPENRGMEPVDIDLSEKIISLYRETIEGLCEKEDDSKTYGEATKIDAENMSTATIVYGPYYTRDRDVKYKNVSLPFVINPGKDNFSTADGEWYVVGVLFDSKPSTSSAVYANTTDARASMGKGVPAGPINIDGYTWNGNASIISNSSESLEGYGMTHDETVIHKSELNPVSFFQWEIDTSDGTRLEISSEGKFTARISYGTWNNRGSDIVKTVSLPYIIDPKSDGLRIRDGNYYVIKVEFQRNPSAERTVEARIVN